MNRSRGRSLLLAAALVTGCARSAAPPEPAAVPALAGAWRSPVQFTSGAFASIKDLEFMYVFNQGGTMTESSNYDGAPPVPPAYGTWREVGPGEFEARYEFFLTRPPGGVGELTGGGGWMPAGRGVLTERISLAADGESFTSILTYEAFDRAGKAAAGGGQATGRGVRNGP